MLEHEELMRRRVDAAMRAIKHDAGGRELHPADTLAVTEAVVTEMIAWAVPAERDAAVLAYLTERIGRRLAAVRLRDAAAVGSA